MATTTRMFCFVLVMVLMGCCCSAKIYKVGDSKGWTTAKHGSYYEWAKLKKFQVGDSLMFEYDGNINDVTQVSSPGHKLVVFVVHDHPMIPPPPPPRKILPLGKDYKVGDSNEWRVPEESDFYSKWSEEKQFHVGDNLLFYYNDQVDDLLEINSDLEFKSCDTTSPVAVHNAGQDLIRLTKPGIRYFITSKIGHCEAGLKLRVVVQPLSKSVPKKMQLSPFDRLINDIIRYLPYQILHLSIIAIVVIFMLVIHKFVLLDMSELDNKVLNTNIKQTGAKHGYPIVI
ncbi:unnamed protein product [Brassica rapa]|uniref:Phytocyanin domain-containing protein n=1 Tax=Brassica campestris TaxID=3711 RepID=A0A3P5YXN1_BRACM|nr:unnamed protein product [Brassica rapa]VDC68105.1 unnamed protein product [Brassica rapa]